MRFSATLNSAWILVVSPYFIVFRGCGDSFYVVDSGILVGRSLFDHADRAVSRIRVEVPPERAALKNAATAEDVSSLIDRAKRGDPAALDWLAKNELPRVERLLRKLLGPRHDLEDLVQITFVETFRALPGFRGESAISTFVAGIAVRVARRAMRPSAWWRRRGTMVDEPVAPEAPERQVIAQEQMRRLRGALERIAPKKQVAFLLWAFEGLSVEDVAKLTDASVAATRSRIFYAQKELRAKAEKDPYLRELLEEIERGAR